MGTTRRASWNRTGSLFGGAAALLLCATGATASDSESIYTSESVTRTRPELGDRVTAEELPFTFLVDPSTPSAGVFALGYNVGLGLGISAD